MTLKYIILNSILISIPEELILFMLVLIILGRYDFIDKSNLLSNWKKVIFTALIPSVVFFNLTIYVLKLSIYVRFTVNGIGLAIFMIILLREKRIIKVLISSFVSLALLTSLEMLIWLFIIYLFRFDITLINSSAYTNFIVSIPSRVILLMVIFIVYTKKNSISEVSVINIWNNNRIFRRFTTIYIVINLAILFHLYNIFAMENAIGNLDYNIQMAIVLTIFIMFIVEMALPWIAIYVIYPSGKYRNKLK